MQKRFLFHIGLPKTGSTSIQSALIALSDDLEARGIRVPYDRALYGRTFPNPAAPRRAPQTDGLPLFCDVPPRRKVTRVDWPAEIERFLADTTADAFVFSHENLSQSGHRLNGALFGRLKGLGEIRFLVYLRHPLSYLNSYTFQALWGTGRSVPRVDLAPIARYLRGGFASQLAPFEAHGTLTLRDYDAARAGDRLVADAFAWFGAEELGETAAALPPQNVRAPRLQLWSVFMAMKIARQPEEDSWVALRDALVAAAAPLEPEQKGLLHPESVAPIQACWDADRAALAARYGLEMPAEAPGFAPGPETLSFSRDYAGALRETAAPHLPPDQRALLEAGLALAGEDIEAVARAALRRRVGPDTARGKRTGPVEARGRQTGPDTPAGPQTAPEAAAGKVELMSPKKTFLFHIGLPKTGSTSIQGALVTLSDELRARGVYFPYDRGLYGTRFPNRAAPAGAPQNDGFTHFVDARTKRLPGAVNWPESIERFLADPALSHYVFSHENFVAGGPRLRAAVFDDLAARGDLAFLVYLRHPLSYLGSFTLWEITGRAGARVRGRQAPTRLYLSQGFAEMLAPFAARGRVMPRDFDVARQDGGLVADAFSAFGAADVVRAAPPVPVLNVSRPRFAMACVLLALKATSTWSQGDWLAIRAPIMKASEALEPQMQTSLLPPPMVGRILDRWAEDRGILAERYGLEMPLELAGFRPGPREMVFSADYAARLRDAVAPDLGAGQRARLERALALADTDIEAYIRDNDVSGAPILHDLGQGRG